MKRRSALASATRAAPPFRTRPSGHEPLMCSLNRSWNSEKPAKPKVWAKRTRVEGWTPAWAATSLIVPSATSPGCCQRKIATWRRRLGKWMVPEDRTARSSS